MKLKSLVSYSAIGISTILFHRKKPVIGSIIITDRCNLSCRHCAVNNITGKIYPFEAINSEMKQLYKAGIRVLFFYGGEPLLWQDQGKTVRDLVIQAKRIGFDLVNIVTNGTYRLNIPEADLIMVSLDGGREKHNEIRGDTYDRILENIRESGSDRIVLYMAINQINKNEIEKVCKLSKELNNVKAVSFNFHTPYPGTEYLKLSQEDKEQCLSQIERFMEEGCPILNLKSAFPHILNNSFQRPCYQCTIVEDGRQWTCGRCIEIEGLCRECGFFFAAEYSLASSGNLKVIFDMVRTYSRYI